MRCLLLATLVALAGCSSVSGSHTRTGPAYPPRAEDCDVRVFLKGEPPPASFVAVGLVEARGTEGVGALIPELVRQACALGADGLIELTSSTGTESTTLGTMSHGQGQITGTSYAVYSATATAVVMAPESTAPVVPPSPASPPEPPPLAAPPSAAGSPPK